MGCGDAIEVFYDATCPLCIASRRWAEAHDHDRRLAFCDLGDPSAAGWAEMLRALPRWRFRARVLGFPPLRWLGPPVYRLVARRRHALVRR